MYVQVYGEPINMYIAFLLAFHTCLGITALHFTEDTSVKVIAAIMLIADFLGFLIVAGYIK